MVELFSVAMSLGLQRVALQVIARGRPSTGGAVSVCRTRRRTRRVGHRT